MFFFYSMTLRGERLAQCVKRRCMPDVRDACFRQKFLYQTDVDRERCSAALPLPQHTAGENQTATSFIGLFTRRSSLMWPEHESGTALLI